LIIAEPETAALLASLGGWPHRVSSALARVEVEGRFRAGSQPGPARWTYEEACLRPRVMLHVHQQERRATIRKPTRHPKGRCCP
jgi:hypothetical protein